VLTGRCDCANRHFGRVDIEETVVLTPGSHAKGPFTVGTRAGAPAPHLQIDADGRMLPSLRETPPFFFTLFSFEFGIVAGTNSWLLMRGYGIRKRFIWTAARFFGGLGTADYSHAGDPYVWA
jgi:hypothetical protein